MGYIVAILIIVVFGLALFGFARPRASGSVDDDDTTSGRRFERTQPAADEPTPGASDTSRPSRIQKAQERVPPA